MISVPMPVSAETALTPSATVLSASMSRPESVSSSTASLAVGVHDHAQVLGHGHARDGDGVLEGHEEARAGALVRLGLRDLLPVEQDLALRHLEVGMTHEDVGQGRLAR